MEPVHEIGQLTFKIELDRLINILYISYYRLDIVALHTIICSPAYSSDNKNLAVGSSLGHTGVPCLRTGVIAVTLPRDGLRMLASGKGMVPCLGTGLLT